MSHLRDTARETVLPGGRGTIELLEDGRGTVRDLAGRAVVTLDAGTVAHYLTELGTDTPGGVDTGE